MVQAKNFARLLSQECRFYDLLWPYVTPYLIYVLFSNVPKTILPLAVTQFIKLLATGTAILFFFKYYRFGPFKPIHGLLALTALPVALAAWIFPFYILYLLGITAVFATAQPETFHFLNFSLRLFNSVILVALFEELFIRVYVMGWLHQAGFQRKQKGLLGSIAETLEQHPAPLTVLPLSTFSVVGATIVFAAGHLVHEYLSAVLYFMFTTWLYKKTGSLWVCIIIHGLTNLTIALLAKYAGMGWLM
jgi:membrane protease YdiL (CAAX protease family)